MTATEAADYPEAAFGATTLAELGELVVECRALPPVGGLARAGRDREARRVP